MSMIGIDVSENQGYVNWNKVKKAGVQFAILRSTKRNGNPDKQLASNIKGCVEADIPFDFYKYMYAVNNSEAKQEALRVVEVLKSYGVMPSRNVIIWADVEDKSLKILSQKALTEIVDNFKEIIVNSGYGFGLYMGKCDYESGEIDVRQFNDNVWIARYYNGYTNMGINDKPNEKYKPVAKCGNLWGWQYTSSGRVDGISGNVDMNIAYYDIKKTEVESEYYQTPEFTLIDSLNKIGVDSSYKNRKEIARANGMQNYCGKKEENMVLLNLLVSGKLVKV